MPSSRAIRSYDFRLRRPAALAVPITSASAGHDGCAGRDKRRKHGHTAPFPQPKAATHVAILPCSIARWFVDRVALAGMCGNAGAC